jgi:hypothetical protein
MPRRSAPSVPEVPGVDLTFRPVSYGADAGPLQAILQNIQGQNRREMVRDFLAGTAADTLGEIDPDLLQDALTDSARVSLGRIHPSFMGGEYLPASRAGQVEIARIVLESATQDVFSIRARRSRNGDRYRYSLVDEYENDFDVSPLTSRRPLSMAGMIHMIDTASSPGLDTGRFPFLEGMLIYKIRAGHEVDEVMDFLAVESEVYPQLQQYYEARLRAWVEQKIA